MGLYRRGKTYWFSFQVDGEKRIHRSLKTGNKKVAETRHAEAVHEITDGIFFEKNLAKATTYDDMVEKYMKLYEHPRDRTSLKQLDRAFSGKTLHQMMATPVVGDYQEQRLQEAKRATVYQELALLRRMFNVARKKWKWTWIRENPVSALEISVGKSNWRYRWLSLEEEMALLEACGHGPGWLKPLVVFALQTGMRRGEILNLMWSDIDVRARFIQIRHSKNGEPRSIPMSEILLATVAAMKVRPLSGRVFQVGINELRWAFERAVKEVGIEDFHFHDLRHTFATRLVQYGVDLYRVQKLLGHRGPEMTQRYAHHVRESITPAIQALDAFYREAAECYKSVTFGENGKDSNR